MDYRLYFLRADGRIDRARNLHCTDDAEAIRLLLDHPRPRALELWHGANRVRALPALDGEPGGPPEYVVYLLRREMIIGLAAFAAGSDVAALTMAAHIFQACDDECDGFEVWRGDYELQARIEDLLRTDGRRGDGAARPPRRGADGSAHPFTAQLASLERHHQHLVVDREMRLHDSFQALHRSRKLLQRIGELKPLFGAFDPPPN